MLCRPATRAALVALVLSALAVAGCGGGISRDSAPVTSDAAGASSATATDATPAAPASRKSPTAPNVVSSATATDATPAAPAPSTTLTTTATVPTVSDTSFLTERVDRTDNAEPAPTDSSVDDVGDGDSTTTPESAPPPTTVVLVMPMPAASTLDGLLALDRPLVIAHAGGDQHYPHSTMYAYWRSVLAGADVLELDVQLTADGVLIVQHDDTVDRTTEATGPVADLRLAEIQALDNAHWFVPGLWGDRTRPADEYIFRGVRGGSVEPPPGFSAEDFRVATFREVAERFSSHVLDVEIKLQRGPDGEADPRSGIAAAQVLAAEIAELGREDSVIVACFNDEVLAAFHRLAPDVATSPGTDELLAWWLVGEALSPRYRVLQVPFTYGGVEVVQPDLVERVHSEGRHVWVWLSGTDVFETREFYAELLRRGVDGVIAGRPATAVAALGEAL